MRGLLRTTTIVGACILLFVAVAWLLLHPLAWWTLTIGWGDRPFDSGGWKTAPTMQQDRDGEHNPRGAMVRSLCRSGQLRGLTRAEVRDVLGEPDTLAYPPTTSDEAWHYYIGWYSGFHMDPDFLAVGFGPDGRVVRWWTWQS